MYIAKITRSQGASEYRENSYLMFLKKILNGVNEVVVCRTIIVSVAALAGYVAFEKNRTLDYQDIYPNGASQAVQEAFELLGGRAIPIIVNANDDIFVAREALGFKYASLLSDSILNNANAGFKDVVSRGASAVAQTTKGGVYNFCLISTTRDDLYASKFTYYHEVGHCAQAFNSGDYAKKYFPSTEEYSEALLAVFGNGKFTKKNADNIANEALSMYPKEVFADVYAYYHLRTKGLMTDQQFASTVKAERHITKHAYKILYNSKPFIDMAIKNPIEKGERFPDFYVRIMDKSTALIDEPKTFGKKVVYALKKS
ncbi:hypothetical protein LMH73_007495 [Vibrio splendidus]|nr:hypothetical protein [Vibrio splendidus]MCC4880373.1 hypothetical protein [Vibrio splendidus]